MQRGVGRCVRRGVGPLEHRGHALHRRVKLAVVGLAWGGSAAGSALALGSAVEGALAEAARGALDRAGLEDVELEADGRDLRLVGTVRHAMQREVALRAVDLAGVRAVDGSRLAVQAPERRSARVEVTLAVAPGRASSVAGSSGDEPAAMQAAVGAWGAGAAEVSWRQAPEAAAVGLERVVFGAVAAAQLGDARVQWTEDGVTVTARARPAATEAARRMLAAVAGGAPVRVVFEGLPDAREVSLALDVHGGDAVLHGVVGGRDEQRRLREALAPVREMVQVRDATLTAAGPGAVALGGGLARAGRLALHARALRVRERPAGLEVEGVFPDQPTLDADLARVGDLSAARVTLSVIDPAACPAGPGELPLPDASARVPAASEVVAALRQIERCPEGGADLRGHPAVAGGVDAADRAARLARLSWALAEAGADLSRWIQLSEEGAR